MRIADSRAAVLTQLWAEIESLRPENRILVALDGFDGAGKSHLSRELADHARRRSSRPVVRVSIDGFHRPKAERVAAGAGPEGFYSGSYRYDAFHACVVDGLRVHGSITPGVWDVDRDEACQPRSDSRSSGGGRARRRDLPPASRACEGVGRDGLGPRAPSRSASPEATLDSRGTMTRTRRLRRTGDTSAVSGCTSQRPGRRSGRRGSGTTRSSISRRIDGTGGEWMWDADRAGACRVSVDHPGDSGLPAPARRDHRRLRARGAGLLPRRR